MSSASTISRGRSAIEAGPEGDCVDWFLRSSRWDGAVWTLAPTSVLDEEHLVQLRWDFLLPSGRRFTDPSCQRLLESARRVIALVRTHSFTRGLPQSSRTVQIYFNHLRMLIRWMDKEGLSRFSDLDAAAVLRFKRTVGERPGRGNKTIAAVTLERHMRVLGYLHRYRESIGDGLLFDPWPGQTVHAACGVHKSQCRSRAYTPDAVAVPLVQAAVDLVAGCASDVLQARDGYAVLMSQLRAARQRDKTRYRKATQWLRARPIRTPLGVYAFRTLSEFYELVDMLYAACFVVIAYLVGARVSEILHLRSGCIQPLGGDGDSGIAVLTGTIFKLEARFHGRSHQWVAPEPVVHAIAVLEALSAPHRSRAGRDDLWLRTRSGFREVTEWEAECREPLWIPSTSRINRWLARFAARLPLPLHDGERWRFSTHQGRKTFARFVALRDRTSLFALAQHLGHRDRAITDAGYVGTDYALQREIEAEVLEQSVTAWEHMLSVPQLGGRAGAEVMARRPRFRGRSMKQDVRSYARLLVETGLTLGVCDWGFCVYRREYSACRGDAFGPNPERREPSTCARCKNFAVTPEHRPYWAEQASRHEVFLRDPALPRQTLMIARQRLTEARDMIRSIDTRARSSR
jgi:integrase